MSEISSPLNRHSHWLRKGVLILLAATFTTGILWRWTSIHQYFGSDTLTRWSNQIQGHPWTPFAVMLAFAIAGLFIFIHAVLLWVTAFVFDPWHAILYCELGTLASALTMYGLGRILRPSVIDRLGGTYAGRVTRDLATRGRWTVILLHWFPICPFSILNLLAGATHINLPDFVIGTIIGCTPGILFVCIIGHRIIEILHHPNALEISALVAFVVVGMVTLRHFHKKLAL